MSFLDFQQRYCLCRQIPNPVYALGCFRTCSDVNGRLAVVNASVLTIAQRRAGTTKQRLRLHETKPLNVSDGSSAGAV